MKLIHTLLLTAFLAISSHAFGMEIIKRGGVILYEAQPLVPETLKL